MHTYNLFVGCISARYSLVYHLLDRLMSTHHSICNNTDINNQNGESDKKRMSEIFYHKDLQSYNVVDRLLFIFRPQKGSRFLYIQQRRT